MPGGNWEQIEEVFLAAADLPSADRVRYLDTACKGNAALRAEVESLLRADSSGSSAITTAIASEVNALLDEDASLVGTRVGAYRLLKEIGRGGMGFVYLGERDDEQYRKLVAIKVVKRGMDSAEVLARFRHERQILAGLEHSYIARLIDGGTTYDGRPFFVMELVEGRPIDSYCREHKLDLESRLKLFVRVCEAVAHAHRALVVHRDLKPGNILVTEEGVPKLLDFGVAKLLAPGSDPGLTSTWSAMGPLTPEYASPEQIQGAPITTATDVYALGAILFELLTGARAQKISQPSPSEIERVVCHVETINPSALVDAFGGPVRVDGELDNIVLMAMRKEPERRYRSANQLAEDVERYLQGRPVLARQDSLAYRTQKFVRRHSVAVVATMLVLASMVGGTALSMMQARRAVAARAVAEKHRQAAEFERGRAEEQTQRAELQTQKAENERTRAEEQTAIAKTEEDRSERRLTQMLQLADRSLFDVHSAIERLPGATEARREIVATTLTFLQNLSKDADQDDRLRFMLSVSYKKVADVMGYPLQPNLGDSKGALENYEKSVVLIEPLLKKEPNRPEYIQQEVEAKIAWATVLERASEVKRAVEMLQSALPAAKRLPRLCPRDPSCWITESHIYSEMVNTLASRDVGAALQNSELQAQSLEKARDMFPENQDIPLELATAYSQQARSLNSKGELSEAVLKYQKAVALRESAMERRPSDVITRRSLMITYGNLGGNLGSPIFANLGDSAGAREYYGKALAIARDLAKADSNDQLAQYDLANALLFYSSLELPKEQWEESLAGLMESEAILMKLVAADPKSIPRARTLATVQEYEGRRLEDLNRRAEAIVQYRLSLAGAEKALTRSPSDLGLITQALSSEEALSEALARQGERGSAIEAAQRAIARAEHVTAPESERDRVHRYAAVAYQNMALVQTILGDWSDARNAAVRAVAGWQQLTASGSHLVDKTKAARAEALLQECDAHLPK